MLRAWPRSLLLFAGLLACPRPQPVDAPEPGLVPELDATFVIRDVQLFDGERAIPRTSVAVKDGRIVAIGPDLRPGPGVEVFDGAGRTLLPGLIDAHTHIYSLDHLRQALVFGVTTELDMFSLPAVTGPLRKLQSGASGRWLADFRSAGILATAPGGHGTEYGFPIPTLTGPDQALAFVDARLSEQSDYIKIVLDDGGGFGRALPTLDLDTVRAIIGAAHDRRQRALVHVSSQREAIAAIDAGADGLVHVFFDSAPGDDFIRRAGERRVFVADTLAVIFAMCARGRGQALVDDPELGPMLAPADVRALTPTWPKGHLPDIACDHALAAVGALHRAAVPLLASTDAPNPGTVHGASLHDELALLVLAGLSPSAALAAATSVPADIFGLDDRGRIAVGKRADLLLVRGDPTREITATRAIDHVWKAGHRLDRASYRDAVAKERAEVATLRAALPPPGADAGKIADFDGGQLTADFGAGWQPATDALIGGASTVELTLIKRGAHRSKGALRITGTVAATETPAKWAGAMFFPGAAPMQPANLAPLFKKKQLVFSARGDLTRTLAIMLFAAQLGPTPLRHEVAITKSWTEFTLPLADLGDLDPYDLTGIFFGATQPGSFALEIDDIRVE